jgi:hypothetical protein
MSADLDAIIGSVPRPLPTAREAAELFQGASDFLSDACRAHSLKHLAVTSADRGIQLARRCTVEEVSDV